MQLLAVSILVVIVVIAIIISFIVKQRAQPTHAGGIVFKVVNGQRLFLMVTSSRIKNKWVFPKGRIEKNETPELTAVREVAEEAGIKAKPVKQAGVVSYKKKGTQITVAYFVMELEGPLSRNTEGRKIIWLTKEETVKRLVNKQVVSIINSL